MGQDHTLFERYAEAIQALPEGALTKDNLLTPRLQMDAEGPLAMYYAPFDYVNTQARVVLVGITPGFTQMAIAHQCARALLHAGQTPEHICREAKRRAAFAGPMRSNLVRMLDGIALHRHLGISSCAALFEHQHHDLLHTTSAVRYPVFREGQNYTGGHPRIPRSPLLRRYVTSVLADELSQAPDALVIPLGRSVSEALSLLTQDGRLNLSRCLIGFPHPSGGNGHREREYAERHQALQHQVEQWFAALSEADRSPATARPVHIPQTARIP